MASFKRIYSWFRTHTKAAIVHSLILSGFLAYCLFFAGPIFDRFDRHQEVEGQARLQDICLPSKTDNITSKFSRLLVRNNVIELEGFAFIDGQSPKIGSIYVVLKSDTCTYVFDTMLLPNPDITVAFPQFQLNLDDSGFVAFISTANITRGEYLIGIYVRNGGTEALQYTNRIAVVSKDGVRLTSLDSTTSPLSSIPG